MWSLNHTPRCSTCCRAAERLLAADRRRRDAVRDLRHGPCRDRRTSPTCTRTIDRRRPRRGWAVGRSCWPGLGDLQRGRGRHRRHRRLVAGSVALVGFGLDSIVEVSSGLIILWQFRHPLPESREQPALRLMAFSFFALAAYVTFESVRSLRPGTTGVLAGRHRARGRLAGRHAVPVLGAAPHRQGPRLQRGGRRLHPDPAVHLPVRGPAGRAGPQRDARLVAGPTRSPDSSSPPSPSGRPRGVARRGMLRARRRPRAHQAANPAMRLYGQRPEDYTGTCSKTQMATRGEPGLRRRPPRPSSIWPQPTAVRTLVPARTSAVPYAHNRVPVNQPGGPRCDRLRVRVCSQSAW